MSLRRSQPGTWRTTQPRGPNGERLCYQCRGEVKRPRLTFCSDHCVHAWRIKTDSGYVRSKVMERDHGICALCSTDTMAGAPPNVRWGRTGHRWQADHIVPVIEGGGECGLDNYRTLCIPCHKRVTAELRQRMKRRRIEAKALPLIDAPEVPLGEEVLDA